MGGTVFVGVLETGRCPTPETSEIDGGPQEDGRNSSCVPIRTELKKVVAQEACRRGPRPRSHSGIVAPEPPNSTGKSFSLGRPSRIGSTVSA